MTPASALPFRVLHVGKFFPPYRGGMEAYLADLAAAQRQNGTDAYALVHGTPLPQDPTWLTRVPVQFHLSYAPVALGFASALRRAIRTLKPDVLHLHMPNNAVFWALLMPSARAIPWVVHWQSDVLTDRMPAWLRLLFKVYRPFEQAVLAQADCIVANSPPYAKASRELTAWQHKCTVVPLGLTAPEPAPEPTPAVSDAPLPPPLPWQGGLRLLSIGRMTYYKNFATLIEAVAGQPGLELAVVGDGELMPQLRAQVQRLCPPGQIPNVHLLGAVSDADKQAMLRSCDVFCLASNERTEAYGLVLLEAMMHAKPCVVANLVGSGMPWIVSSSGAGWAHLPPNDAQAWRQFLLTLPGQAVELCRRGQRGQRAYTQRFTAQANAQVLQRVYAAITQAPRVPADAAHPQRHTTLIVIPAKDEAATLPTVLADLKAHGWPHVLVVDDLSSDGTGDLARHGGALVARPMLPLGAWGGMQLGIRWAYAHGYARVITMDADGQHEVDELPHLLHAAAHADAVIGAFPDRASSLRRVAWWWFQGLTGLRVTDLTSGFRCYNHRAMEVLASEEATLLDYQDVGTLLLLRRAGLQVAEVPVSMNARLSGVSRIFSSWGKVGRYMAVTTVLCLARWGRSIRRVDKEA